MGVVKAQKLNLNNVTFSETRDLNIPGAKLSYINLNGDKIIVQGPRMRTVSGVRRWLNKENGKYDYDIELSFDEKSDELLKKSQELDEIIKSSIKRKSKDWLGKESISDELLNDKYKPIVKTNEQVRLKNGEVKDFPPSIVLKLQVENNRFVSSKETDLLVFNESNQQVSLSVDDFTSGEKVDAHKVLSGNMTLIPVFEVSFLSFTKTTIKPRLKLVQAKIFPTTSNKITENIMEDDYDEDNEDNEDNDQQDDLDTTGTTGDKDEPVEESIEPVEESIEPVEEVKAVPKRGRAKK